jgi:outer membrane lipoprotein SlyB
MRTLTIKEINQTCGGDATQDFNQCMAESWGENTVVGAVAGAFVGGFAGAILGGMGGSTGTGIWCGLKAIF